MVHRGNGIREGSFILLQIHPGLNLRFPTVLPFLFLASSMLQPIVATSGYSSEIYAYCFQVNLKRYYTCSYNWCWLKGIACWGWVSTVLDSFCSCPSTVKEKNHWCGSFQKMKVIDFSTCILLFVSWQSIMEEESHEWVNSWWQN